jgi:hypothetical protein
MPKIDTTVGSLVAMIKDGELPVGAMRIEGPEIEIGDTPATASMKEACDLRIVAGRQEACK